LGEARRVRSAAVPRPQDQAGCRGAGALRSLAGEAAAGGSRQLQSSVTYSGGRAPSRPSPFSSPQSMNERAYFSAAEPDQRETPGSLAKLSGVNRRLSSVRERASLFSRS